MFRHRKRLISKRLTKIMRNKTEQNMKKSFAKFLQSRLGQIQSLIPQQQEEEVEQSISEEIIQEQIEQVGSSEMSLPAYISSLSNQQKQMFKRQNPDLPQTFFMSKKQKQKYFGRKNSQFQNGLKHTPQRVSKNKNHVHFTPKFSFKPFCKQQKAAQVQKAKQFSVPYDSQIHYS